MTKNLSTDELVLPTATRILVAAREVVLESGYAALSTRAVVDRAGRRSRRSTSILGRRNR